MNLSTGLKSGMLVYDFLWNMMIPLLKRNQRLRAGFAQRTLAENILKPADIWIQAASVGEALLVPNLLEAFNPPCPVSILATSGTDQGLYILKSADQWNYSDRITFDSAYFPFDRPAIMQNAVASVRPKLAVLLETEIWPGFIAALKQNGIKILLINGRIKPQSLRLYRLLPSLWNELKPDRILAVSDSDAQRFGRLFTQSRIRVMHNIKFDQISFAPLQPVIDNPLFSLLGEKTVLTFGSVRQEEEMAISRIIRVVCQQKPDTVLCVFPRHLHRIAHWRKTLTAMNINWVLRSTLRHNVDPGMVVLWDVIGELKTAYQLSQAVFIGGSLAPLGGQNFLEPLSQGVIPIMGPSHDSFAWVGRDIFIQGLVRVGQNAAQVTQLLLEYLEHPPLRESVMALVRRYFISRKGGSRQACKAIHFMIASSGISEYAP